MSVTHRKLTTIFSADVQGYSRLMEADEEGTLATLKQYREAMERLIEAHGGRVINTWGDGLIAEFPSVVESVRVAIDVQNELAGRNAGRSDATRMQFRIGINLGDVIVEGDDIYGDGVNIAARLQSSAAPGGIVISNTVYDQVRNKMSVGFEFLGSLSVKNIEETVPSYAVRIGGQPGEAKPGGEAGRAAFRTQPGACRASGRDVRPGAGGHALPEHRCRAGSPASLVIGAGLDGHQHPHLERHVLGTVAAAGLRRAGGACLGKDDAARRSRSGVARRDRAWPRRHQSYVMVRGVLGRLADLRPGGRGRHSLGHAAAGPSADRTAASAVIQTAPSRLWIEPGLVPAAGLRA